MPKLHEMMDSKYMKKEDLVEGAAIVTIVSIEQKNVAMDDQPVELKWTARLAEFRKPLVLNPTNLQLLAKIIGSDDSDDWINKRVVLYVDDNVSFGGKIVGGLRVRAIRKPPMGATNRQPVPAVDEMEDDIPF
jgi:hypothetical protein